MKRYVVYSDSETLRFSDATMHAPLKTSLALDVGVGDPVFLRNSVSWAFDDEGILREIPANGAIFGGARPVYNLFNPSTTLTTRSMTLEARVYTVSFTGTGTLSFSGEAYAGADLVGTGVEDRVSRTFTAAAGTATFTVAGTCIYAQLEIGSYLSDYVSRGSLTGAYHYAGIDGLKWFAFDGNGDAINDRLLTGVRIDPGSYTNDILYCRNLQNNNWRPSESGAAIYTADGSSATGWVDGTEFPGTVASVGGVLQVTSTIDFGGVYHILDTVTAGQVYVVSYDYRHLSGDGHTYAAVGVSGSESVSVSNGLGPFTTSTTVIRGQITYTASSTSERLVLRNSKAGAVGEFSNISVALAGIKTTLTEVGIDGVANSASLLECTAANATIGQKIIAAAAAGCTGVYIKRHTGSGTISISRDGGSNWTDVTSSLSADAFYNAKVENSSVADPIVMIRMGTSGDKIIVDGFLNHLGTELTYPILTTSAAVTREADSLYYQRAGNMGNAEGKMMVTFSPIGSAWKSGGIVGNTDRGLFTNSTTSGVQAKDGTSIASGQAKTPGGQMVVGMAWIDATFVAINGGEFGDVEVYDENFGLSTLSICKGTGGYVRNLVIYPSYDQEGGSLDSQLEPVFATDFTGITLTGPSDFVSSVQCAYEITGTDTATDFPPPYGQPIYALSTTGGFGAGYGVLANTGGLYPFATNDESGVNARHTTTIQDATVRGVVTKSLKLSWKAPGGLSYHDQQSWLMIYRNVFNPDLDTATLRFSFKLPDMENCIGYPAILGGYSGRITVFDYKTHDGVTGGDFRYTVQAVRSSISTYFWELQCDSLANGTVTSQIFWTFQNTVNRVTKNEWADFDISYIRPATYSDLTTGRYRLRVRYEEDDAETWTTLFDVNASTIGALNTAHGTSYSNRHMGENNSFMNRMFHGNYARKLDVDCDIEIANYEIYDTFLDE